MDRYTIAESQLQIYIRDYGKENNAQQQTGANRVGAAAWVCEGKGKKKKKLFVLFYNMALTHLVNWML